MVVAAVVVVYFVVAAATSDGAAVVPDIFEVKTIIAIFCLVLMVEGVKFPLSPTTMGLVILPSNTC